MHDDYVVHGIMKAPNHEVRIALTESGGRGFVNIRQFHRNKRGEWIASGKGCTVPIERLGELQLAVDKLRFELQRPAWGPRRAAPRRDTGRRGTTRAGR